jgi:hypothetical protein
MLNTATDLIKKLNISKEIIVVIMPNIRNKCNFYVHVSRYQAASETKLFTKVTQSNCVML